MTWTCRVCHYNHNSDDETRCLMCGSKHCTGKIIRKKTDIINTQPDCDEDSATTTDKHLHYKNTSIPHCVSHSKDTTDREKILTGRVSEVEQRYENPPLNIYRLLSCIIIGIVLAIPFILIFIGSAIISLAFAIIGLRTLYQFFNPLSWTVAIAKILEVIVLRRFRSDNKIPIIRGMVLDNQNREHSFMMQGPLHRGNLFVGQEIRLYGHWSKGSFMVRKGVDLTTGALVISAHKDPWPVIFYLIVTLFLILGAMSLFNFNNLMSFIRLNIR